MRSVPSRVPGDESEERSVEVVRRQQWLAGEQAERSRWARELHDETLQGMAAIRCS